jgi:hypothetical protein
MPLVVKPRRSQGGGDGAVSSGEQGSADKRLRTGTIGSTKATSCNPDTCRGTPEGRIQSPMGDTRSALSVSVFKRAKVESIIIPTQEITRQRAPTSRREQIRRTAVLAISANTGRLGAQNARNRFSLPLRAALPQAVPYILRVGVSGQCHFFAICAHSLTARRLSGNSAPVSRTMRNLGRRTAVYLWE